MPSSQSLESTPKTPESTPEKRKIPTVETVQVKVSDPNGQILTFKIKKHAVLSKLMNAYCQKQNLDIKGIRFFYDGTRINLDDTAEKLGLVDEDVIDVFTEQTAGNL